MLFASVTEGVACGTLCKSCSGGGAEPELPPHRRLWKSTGAPGVVGRAGRGAAAIGATTIKSVGSRGFLILL